MKHSDLTIPLNLFIKIELISSFSEILIPNSSLIILKELSFMNVWNGLFKKGKPTALKFL